ncbi:OLC1v1018800C1 [Oldenlandia corymbosa var. corymbosa]|uniref:OLC1v1018800C1 n=1 Tax=Oldenlandia corymbosa var. corymbosa TaxID=529605 RepID=A0AAV1ECJ5_OLDCO|nr:OLC1v1018800C1 [Oldenlandia corymbosa var. corymbosa]
METREQPEEEQSNPRGNLVLNQRESGEEQDVKYELKPVKCTNCKGYGHEMKECRKPIEKIWQKRKEEIQKEETVTELTTRTSKTNKGKEVVQSPGNSVLKQKQSPSNFGRNVESSIQKRDNTDSSGSIRILNHKSEKVNEVSAYPSFAAFLGKLECLCRGFAAFLGKAGCLTRVLLHFYVKLAACSGYSDCRVLLSAFPGLRRVVVPGLLVLRKRASDNSGIRAPEATAEKIQRILGKALNDIADCVEALERRVSGEGTSSSGLGRDDALESVKQDVLILKRTIEECSTWVEREEDQRMVESLVQDVALLKRALACGMPVGEEVAPKAEYKSGSNTGEAKKGRKDSKSKDRGKANKQFAKKTDAGKSSSSNEQQKKRTGCFKCDGPHMAWDRPYQEKINAIIAGEAEETVPPRLNPMKLLYAITMV